MQFAIVPSSAFGTTSQEASSLAPVGGLRVGTHERVGEVLLGVFGRESELDRELCVQLVAEPSLWKIHRKSLTAPV